MLKVDYIKDRISVTNDGKEYSELYKCRKPCSYVAKNTYWSLDVYGEVYGGNITLHLQHGKDKRGIGTVEYPIDEFVENFDYCI